MLILYYLVWLFIVNKVQSKTIDKIYIGSNNVSFYDEPKRTVVVHLTREDNAFEHDALYGWANGNKKLFRVGDMLIIGGGFTEVPQDLFAGFVFLRALIFDRGKLKSIPMTLLRGMRKLSTFMIVDHQLESLPDELFQDTHQLKILSFENNKIEYIPKSDIFQNLPNLIYLSLAKNLIVTMSQDLSQMLSKYSQLVRINLDGNYLSDWPNQQDSSGSRVDLTNSNANQSSTFISDPKFLILGQCVQKDIFTFSISEVATDSLISVHLNGLQTEFVHWVYFWMSSLTLGTLEIYLVATKEEISGPDLSQLCGFYNVTEGFQYVLVVCESGFPASSIIVIKFLESNSLRLCNLQVGTYENTIETQINGNVPLKPQNIQTDGKRPSWAISDSCDVSANGKLWTVSLDRSYDIVYISLKEWNVVSIKVDIILAGRSVVACTGQSSSDQLRMISLPCLGRGDLIKVTSTSDFSICEFQVFASDSNVTRYSLQGIWVTQSESFYTYGPEFALSTKCKGSDGYSKTPSSRKTFWMVDFTEAIAVKRVYLFNLNSFTLNVRLANTSLTPVQIYGDNSVMMDCDPVQSKFILQYSDCRGMNGRYLIIHPNANLLVDLKICSVKVMEIFSSEDSSFPNLAMIRPSYISMYQNGQLINDSRRSFLFRDDCKRNEKNSIRGVSVYFDFGAVYNIVGIEFRCLNADYYKVGKNETMETYVEVQSHNQLCSKKIQNLVTDNIYIMRHERDLVELDICNLRFYTTNSTWFPLANKPTKQSTKYQPLLNAKYALSPNCMDSNGYSKSPLSNETFWKIDMRKFVRVAGLYVGNLNLFPLAIRLSRRTEIYENNSEMQNCESVEGKPSYHAVLHYYSSCSGQIGRYLIIKPKNSVDAELMLCSVKVFEEIRSIQPQLKTMLLKSLIGNIKRSDGGCETIPEMDQPHWIADLKTYLQIFKVTVRIVTSTLQTYYVFLTRFKPNFWAIEEENICAKAAVGRDSEVTFNCVGMGRYVMIMANEISSLKLCKVTAHVAEPKNTRFKFTSPKIHNPKYFWASLALRSSASCDVHLAMFSLTKEERNPSWSLNLGSVILISSIHLLLVNKEADERSEWKLIFDVLQQSTEKTCSIFRGNVKTGFRLPITCGTPLSGNNVKITRRGAKVALGLCGIEIYTPLLKQSCQPPLNIENGYHYPKKANYFENEEVRFYCKRKFFARNQNENWIRCLRRVVEKNDGRKEIVVKWFGDMKLECMRIKQRYDHYQELL